VHYGVELWVPEVGGRVDPGSDAHDLVMLLYGGMSKGERNRIKLRVRSAMATQAQTEGRFLGGRPPYGYRLGDAGVHPNPGKASMGARLHRSEADPATAPIVQRIFAEYLDGRGLYAIAEGLTRDAIPSPSAADPERNRHRSGVAWSKSAVRAILGNPRSTGREVWNRQRRDEVLIDVEDVAQGHETKMRWNDRGEWIWSAQSVDGVRSRRPAIERSDSPAARPREISSRSASDNRNGDRVGSRFGRRCRRLICRSTACRETPASWRITQAGAPSAHSSAILALASSEIHSTPQPPDPIEPDRDGCCVDPLRPRPIGAQGSVIGSAPDVLVGCGR
jgi:DNA invertase Pin-like site-specific DNA recombinase